MRKILRNGAFFLVYLLTTSTAGAQSVEEIRDYEEWCGLGQYSQGHTPGTQSFIDCVNHYIGPLLIQKGLAEEYTGSVSSYGSSRRNTQEQQAISDNVCINAADYKGCMEYHNGETTKNNSDEQEDNGPSAEAVGRAIERSLNILQDTFSPSQPTYNRGGFNPGLSNLETNLMQQRMYDQNRQNNQQRFNRAHPNYAY